MQVTVTSKHSWHKFHPVQVYTIVDGKCTKKQTGDTVVEYNGSFSIEDFYDTFSRFGLLEKWSCPVKIDLPEGLSLAQFIKAIHNIPIQSGDMFAHFKKCGCNMGHCDLTTKIIIKTCTSYGDLMAFVGVPVYIDDDILSYMYPDSVFLEMERENGKTFTIVEPGTHKPVKTETLIFNNGLVSFYYTR